MLLPALLLTAFLGASHGFPELDGFLTAALRNAALEAVEGELDPLLLPSHELLSGLATFQIENAEATSPRGDFAFTARIPRLHLSAQR